MGARRGFSRRKLGGRQSAQRAVRPLVIVIIAERFDQITRRVQVEKLVFVVGCEYLMSVCDHYLCCLPKPRGVPCGHLST